MARIARTHAPGAIHHVTAKFSSAEFRIHTDAERAEYLRRLAGYLERSDWRLLSYAIMSNHIHLGFEAGQMPIQLIMQPLQGGYALWLNGRQGRSGYVWKERFHQVIGDTPAWAAHMISYQHNNPVRAGVANAAWDSTWTSHCAYVGLAKQPEWLDVERGLELCGYTATTHGRRQFDELVLRRQHIGRDEWLSPTYVFGIRRKTRKMTGWPLEAGTPEIAPAEDTIPDGVPCAADAAEGLSTKLTVSIPMELPREHAGALQWRYDVNEVIALACAMFFTEEREVRGQARGTLVASVRRTIVWAWVRLLGGSLAEVSRALNRVRSNFCHALDEIDRNLHAHERILADALATEVLSRRAIEPQGGDMR